MSRGLSSAVGALHDHDFCVHCERPINERCGSVRTLMRRTRLSLRWRILALGALSFVEALDQINPSLGDGSICNGVVDGMQRGAHTLHRNRMCNPSSQSLTVGSALHAAADSSQRLRFDAWSFHHVSFRANTWGVAMPWHARAYQEGRRRCEI
jgi:hypothetical protein